MVIKLKDGSIHICLENRDLINLIEEKLGSDISSKIEELIKANDDEIIDLKATIVELENDIMEKEIEIDELQYENTNLEDEI